MTDHIEPALSAEEWEAHGDTRLRAGDLYALGNARARWEDYELPPTTAGAIAILNHDLPDSDPRKITREMVGTIAGAARAIEYDNGGGDENDVATWNSKLAIEVAAIAKALASYLPPA